MHWVKQCIKWGEKIRGEAEYLFPSVQSIGLAKKFVQLFSEQIFGQPSSFVCITLYT